MYDSLWGHYLLRTKPVLAGVAEGFTPLRVIYLLAFIDLTHEKKASVGGNWCDNFAAYEHTLSALP